jgi:hypothetical protein
MQVHEFVCADCKADVYSYGGDPNATLCYGCELIATMKLTCTAEQIATLREILHCMIEDTDHVRASDHGSGQ